MIQFHTNRQCLNDTTPLLRRRVRQVVQVLRAPVPGELAAEERSDEPRVASVRSDGAAAARDAGGVPDAPRVEPAHRDAADVSERVPVIRRPLALRHSVPRRLVRIDDERQKDVRMLSGDELVERVRDDVLRATAREDEDDAIPTSPYLSPVEERLQARPQRLLLSVRNDALEEALDLRRARDAVAVCVRSFAGARLV